MADTAPASGAIAGLGGTVDEALSEVRVPAYVLGSDGVIRWLNKRALDLLGDLTGQSFAVALMPASRDSARVAFARKIMGTEQAADYNVTLRSPHGPVSGQVSSVALHGGERVVGVFGVIHFDENEERPSPVHDPHLSPRQREVLGHLAAGCSTDQIAAKLGVSRETVRNHVRGVLRALGVHSRLEAVAAARRSGLLAD